MDDIYQRENFSVIMPVISFPPAIGGAEKQAFKLGMELSQIGIDVYTITKWMKGRKYIRKKLKIYQSPIVPFLGKKFATLLFGLYAFYLIIALTLKRRRNLLIHCFGDEISLINAFIANRLFNIKYVAKMSITIDQQYIDTYYNSNTIEKRFLYKLRDQSLRNAKRVFVQDQASIDVLNKKLGFSLDQLLIIRNGVIPASNKFAKNKVMSIPGKLKNGEFTILYVGRIEPHKGLIYLIDAFNKIQQVYPKSKLWIVGDGSQRVFLEDSVREKGIENIIFWGSQVQTDKFYRKADIFVLPSSREGLPNALLEAMANACIPISTDVGGITEMITNDKNGVLISARNVDDIVVSIKKLCEDIDRATNIAKTAYDFVCTNFSMKKNVEKHLEVYRNLIKHG